MKQLLLDYLSKYEDGYKHRNAIRWLKNREPKLWQRIVAATSFLDDPKPKQRCWHILNDVWEHPRCPISGEKVKWFDDRYLTYISVKAQMADPANRAVRQQTMIDKYGAPHALQTKKFRKKVRQTCIQKYGVSNVALSEEHMKRMAATRRSTGSYRSKEELTEIEKYTQAVWRHTHKNWRKHKDRIANGLQRGREFHLDHIYPKILGFKESIPPEIIGHWTNLRLIPAKQNLAKHAKVEISRDELLENYRKSLDIR